MAPSMKIVFGLLTFVTVGMIIDGSLSWLAMYAICILVIYLVIGVLNMQGGNGIGALFQLAFIRRLEDSYGSEFPSHRKMYESRKVQNQQLPRGIARWADDKEATILRLGYVKPEVISWLPRIILFHDFLSMAECDYLRAIATNRLQVSTVVDTATGKGVKSDVRTSSGMFLNNEERNYPMIKAIEKRISVYSQIPIENGELIQVLRYEKHQYYRSHHDYFSDSFNLKRGGQRVATMLMYLSDSVEGGETYFPMAGSGDCSCGGKMMKGKCIKPVRGNAVLFWSMTACKIVIEETLHDKYKDEMHDVGLDGQSDPKSIHGGCEVLSGEKWSATKWMRQEPTS